MCERFIAYDKRFDEVFLHVNICMVLGGCQRVHNRIRIGSERRQRRGALPPDRRMNPAVSSLYGAGRPPRDEVI